MILQTLEELEGDLRKNGFRRVYVILGQEHYRAREAINLLKKKALLPESISFDYSEFSGADAAADGIMASAGTFPMLAKRRVILVTEADRLKEDEQEKLINSLKNQEISPRSMLILVAENLDHRKRFYKILHELACVVEFQKLKGSAMERWAESFVRREGYRISVKSLKHVIELAGQDLQSLSSELEKLFLRAGKEKTIPDSAVEDMVRSSRQHSIFELLDAVGNRDRKGALRLLANLLQREAPSAVTAMMARHCRQVLIAKECILEGNSVQDTAKAAQISPYFLDKFLRQARNADTSVIRQMYIHLAEIDRRLKSSAGDGPMMLEKLICELV